MFTVAERDRHLDDPEPGEDGPVRQLDLEGVAARAHGAQLDRLEHLAPEALEAAGEVAHGQPEHEPGVQAADAADEPAQRSPAGDPPDVERLIRAVVDDGAHLALGSRYAPGGRVADWGPWRRIISRGGCLYAQLVLGLPVRDLTGGFKCFRREVLEAVDLDTVRSRGYAFQVELTHRAVRAGFRVVEVPITFRDRELGRSKMSWGIAGEAVVLLPRLRRRPSVRTPAGAPAAVPTARG